MFHLQHSYIFQYCNAHTVRIFRTSPPEVPPPPKSHKNPRRSLLVNEVPKFLHHDQPPAHSSRIYTRTNETGNKADGFRKTARRGRERPRRRVLRYPTAVEININLISSPLIHSALSYSTRCCLQPSPLPSLRQAVAATAPATRASGKHVLQSRFAGVGWFEERRTKGG